MGSTVDAVMEEDAQEPLLRPRRGLFSRRRLVETEELYAPPEPEPEEIPEIDTIGPEPELADAAADYRAEAKRRRRPLLAAALAALLPVIPLGIEAYGYEIQYWTDSAAVQSGVLLACLAVVSILARQVFAKAFPAAGAKALHQRAAGGDLRGGDGGGLRGPPAAAGPERRRLLRPGGVLCPGVRHVGRRPGEPGDVGHLPDGLHRRRAALPGDGDGEGRLQASGLRPRLLHHRPAGGHRRHLADGPDAGGAGGLHRVRGAQLPGPGAGRRLPAELVRHPGGGHHLRPAPVLGDALLQAGRPLPQGGLRRGRLVRRGEDQPPAGHDPDGRGPVPAGDHPAQRREGVRRGPVQGLLLRRLHGPGRGLRPPAAV